MNSIMERWVQTCQRELLDRTLIWNRSHLLHVLREFEQFYNWHRPHQGIANVRPLQPLPVPLVVPDQIPALIYDDATDSAACSTNTNMRHELHGWGFRQGQPRYCDGAAGPPLSGDACRLPRLRSGTETVMHHFLHGEGTEAHSLGNGDGQRPNVRQICLLQGTGPDYHRSEGYGHLSTSRYFQLSARAVPLS